MSGERVDLDDLRTLAVAAQESADYREDMQRKGMARWILSPRRDGTVDVVLDPDGADVFDRALPVDAAFAVAAQPVVVVALVDHVGVLTAACRRTIAETDLCPCCDHHPSSGHLASCPLERGPVLP